MKHRKIVKLLTIVILLASLQGFAAKIKKGPYLILPNNPEKMCVMIQTDGLPMTSLIRWGTTTDYSTGTGDMELLGDDHQYRKVIEGLVPNTRYFYEVDIDGTKHKGTFRSAPAADAINAVFYLVGDTRSRPDWVNELQQAMLEDINEDAEKRESVWLHCGDWVGNDGEDKWQGKFFNRDYPFTLETMRRVPIMGCRGNHEDGGHNYIKYWPYTETVEETTVTVPDKDKHYYSFDYGPAHVAVLDCYLKYDTNSTQYKWLLADLKASNKPWTILQWHVPAYTAGGHGDRANLQVLVRNLQDAGLKIDLVNSGHSHFYARVEVDEVVYLTTGGGGVNRKAGPSPPVGRIKASYGGLSFARIEIDGGSLFGEAKNEKGQVVDSFRVVRGPRLVYGEQYYKEANENDGSINKNQTTIITVQEASFAADIISGAHIAPENLPEGLKAVFVRDSDTQVTMSLTGKAIEHGDKGIEAFQVVFADKAFNGTTAKEVSFTTKDCYITFKNPKFNLDGDGWRYMKGTVEPPVDWSTLAFDDSAWLAGKTPLGYNDKEDRARYLKTNLTDMKGNYSTVYLRRKFTITDPKVIAKVELNISYNDAYALYINGTLIKCVNLGVGKRESRAKGYKPNITHKSTAKHSGNRSHSAVITEKALDVFKKGENVLCLVLINGKGKNSDAIINAGLSIGYNK